MNLRFPLLLLLLPGLFWQSGPAAESAASNLPTETLTLRELRGVAGRERAIWERLKADPDNPDMKLRAEAEFRDIITAYENVIRADPQFAEAWAAYGLILSRTGNRENATKAFLRANKIDPNIALVKNQLGNFLIEEGNYKEALPYYLQAIELEPGEALYHYQLGAALREFADFFVADGLFDRTTLDTKSHGAFRQAAELAPETWGYIYRYAESFYDFAAPDWPAALAVWRQLEERARPGPEIQTVRLHLARVLAEMEQPEESRALLETITEPALEANKQTVIELLSELAKD